MLPGKRWGKPPTSASPLACQSVAPTSCPSSKQQDNQTKSSKFPRASLITKFPVAWLSGLPWRANTRDCLQQALLSLPCSPALPQHRCQCDHQCVMGTSVTRRSWGGGSALGLWGLWVHAQTTFNTYMRHLPSCHLSQNIFKTQLLRAVVGHACNPSMWEVAGTQGHLSYS